MTNNGRTGLPPKTEIESATNHIAEIIKRTGKENPKPEDVKELQRLLKEYPDLWKFAGDLAEEAQERMIKNASPQALFRESVKHSAVLLRKKLTQKTDTFLELMVIQQCITAHIQHYIIELQYQNAHYADHLTLEQGMYWEKRLSASQRRYLRVLETLARVRRLAKPPMQINIGENQTNIAANSTRSETPGDTKTIEGETVDG